MNPIESILVVVPHGAPAARALRRAVALVTNKHTRYTVMDVVHEISPLLRLAKWDLSAGELERTLIDHRRAELEALIADNKLGKAMAASGAVSVKVLVGSDFLEVTREVLRSGHGLVIKPAEGLKAPMFGSHDMHLIRKCPCPVWILKNGRAKAKKRILAAVDPVGEENFELSLDVLGLAAMLARKRKRELHVVHAWHFAHEAALRRRGVVAERTLHAMKRDMEASHRERLRKLLESSDAKPLVDGVHLIEGLPAAVIPSTAERVGFDFVVMGTVARTGISGLLIGNTAERVLHRMGCSVLTVKPRGFVTPVTLD